MSPGRLIPRPLQSAFVVGVYSWHLSVATGSENNVFAAEHAPDFVVDDASGRPRNGWRFDGCKLHVPLLVSRRTCQSAAGAEVTVTIRITIAIRNFSPNSSLLAVRCSLARKHGNPLTAYMAITRRKESDISQMGAKTGANDGTVAANPSTLQRRKWPGAAPGRFHPQRNDQRGQTQQDPQ